MLRSITHYFTTGTVAVWPLPVSILPAFRCTGWNPARKGYLHLEDNPQLQLFFFLHVFEKLACCCETNAALTPGVDPTRLAKCDGCQAIELAGVRFVCSEDNRSNYLIIVTLAEFRSSTVAAAASLS